MRAILLLGGFVLGLLSTVAPGAEPDLIRADDDIHGTLPAAGMEAGFAFDALGGSEVQLKVKATEGTLEPEILLFDPGDVRILLGGRYKHSPGSEKAKLRWFELPSTGRYTIVVRGLSSTAGAFRLTVKAEHPEKFKDSGQLEFAFESDLPRFSAFLGATLTFKVKGKDGLWPAIRSLLRPDTAEVNVPGVINGDSKSTGSDFVCPLTGDYRLRVESLNGVAGRWKGKIKLAMPSVAPQTLLVPGEPEGTFTDDKKEPGSVPNLPVRDILSTAEFRLTLSILDPQDGLIWESGQNMSLMVTLENITNGDIEIGFRSDPWNDIVVRDVQSTSIVWRLNPGTLPFASRVTLPGANGRSWPASWDVRSTTGALLAPGEYDIVATFATDDVRIPQEARIRIRVE